MVVQSAKLPTLPSHLCLCSTFSNPRTKCGSGLITCCGTDKLCLKIRTIKKATLLLRHCEVQGIMVVLKVENNTTTEWPEPRATNCSEFTQTIGMAASPFLVLVSLLRSRQRLSLLALAHVKVLLLACSRQGSHGSMLAFLSLVPIQNSSYKIRNGLGANREPLQESCRC